MMGYYRGGDGNCYGRGDYYRGDYYQGDFLGIGKALKKVAGFAYNAFVPAPIRTAVGAVGGVLHPGRPPGGVALTHNLADTPLVQNVVNDFAAAGAGPLVTTGLGGPPAGTMLPGAGGFLPGVCGLKGTHVNRSSYFKKVPGNPLAGVRIPKGSVCVKNRRMNPANGRALGRALRRAYAFKKIAMRTLHLLSPAKPKRFGGFKKKRRS